jgi:hypothetical protein
MMFLRSIDGKVGRDIIGNKHLGKGVGVKFIQRVRTGSNTLC